MRIKKCRKGCHYWYLEPSSCFHICREDVGGSEKSDPISPYSNGQDNYCAFGCNHAHTVYADHIHNILTIHGALSSVRLVANSLSNDSLTIEWNSIPDYLNLNLSFQIQWKYANLPSKWLDVGDSGLSTGIRFAANQNKIANRFTRITKAHLIGLNAYTNYLFRLKWTLLPSPYSDLLSEPSATITTLPYGVPRSACVIVNCLAISSNQISISWKAPVFSNAPIIAYSLYLINERTGHRTVKDIHIHWYQHQSDQTKVHNYVFNDLSAQTKYTIIIATHNNFGEGPRCQKSLFTLEKHPSKNNDVDTNYEQFEQFKLYLASSKSITRRNIDMLLEEEVLYHLTDYVENAEITSMAIHIAYRFLFVADSSGTIRRILLNKNSINQVVRIVNGINQPTHLNVDWLNDRLYWLEEPNYLMRSNLDGESVESIYIDSLYSNQKPIDFKVDPYNGYFFWLQTNIFNRTMIYRLDMYHLDNSKPKAKLRSNVELIYQSDVYIPTFTLNFLNYRLILPMIQTNSIHSITIDGNDETSIRDNSNYGVINDEQLHSETIKKLSTIANMLVYNQKLFFISGENISWEEYHTNETIYYYNTFMTDSKLISIAMMDAQCQPIPVPLTPVENVEAVFLDTSAKISWQKPSLFGASGRGAWQKWRYEIAIQESDDAEAIHYAEVNDMTQCDAVELKPNTEYEIKVRAFTEAGYGAWSSKFIGKTLAEFDETQDEPYILVASNDSLTQTHLDGRFKQKLISKSKIEGTSITEIELYDDLVFLNTEKQILVINQSDFDTFEAPNLKVLIERSNAQSIAIEWMAPKLYWSNPLERMICRSNLDGSQVEVLPIITYAEEIVIDSIRGLLYWSTSSSLRLSLINGQKDSQSVIVKSHYIKSVSIDQDNSKLFWISEEPAILEDQELKLLLNEIDLFQSISDVHQLKADEIHITRIQESISLIGPIGFFANRFWWLDQENHHILVSNRSCKTFATIRQLSGVNTFRIVSEKSSMVSKLEQFIDQKEVRVVPTSVDPSLIRIVGTWENFTIQWDPISNVNYGEVFYDLTLENDRQKHESKATNFVLRETEFVLPEYLKPSKPYSEIRIAIRAFTYWASAKQVMVTLHSPSSIPSKPISVRIFTYLKQDTDNIIFGNENVQHLSNEAVTAEARWNKPENPNGLIQSYTLSLWTVDSNLANNNKVSSIINKVIPNQLSYNLTDLKPNSTYYFEVRATTDIGEGPPSDVVQFKTFRSEPPMKLLLSERDSIKEIDMDSLKERSVIKSLAPSAIDYHMAENRLYFVEDGRFLKSSNLLMRERYSDQNLGQKGQSGNFSILAYFSHPITCLSMDWIARRLYVSTVDYRQNQSTIWLYEEETSSKHPIQTVNGFIHTLKVDPFRSMLLWTEQILIGNRDFVSIKQCFLSINGSLCLDKREYFQNPSRDRLCNCTHTPNISGAFMLITDEFSPIQKIIYFDRNEQTFVRCSDGCFCKRITSFIETHSPPNSILFDRIANKLYWKNETINGLIYSTRLVSNHLEDDFKQQINAIEIGKFARSLAHLSIQKYPNNLECLIPPTYLKVNLSIIEQSSTFVRIRIDLNRTEQISNNFFVQKCPWIQSTKMTLSLASIRYKIKLSQTNHTECFEENHFDFNSNEKCKSIITYNQTILIANLQPFTNYTLSLELDNFYLTLLKNQSQKRLDLARNASLVMISKKDFISKNHQYDHLKVGFFRFATTESKPAPPREIKAIVESPEKIKIIWKSPEVLNAPHVAYEVRWYSLNNSSEMKVRSERQSWVLDWANKSTEEQHSIYLNDIVPGNFYNVSVRVYAIQKRLKANGNNYQIDHYQFHESEPITVRAYDSPNNVQLKYVSSRQIDIEWYTSDDSIIESHEIWYKQEESKPSTNSSESSVWNLFSKERTKPSHQYSYQLKRLKPNTGYQIKFILKYRPFGQKYEWPRPTKYLRIVTNMSVPDGPESLEIETISSEISDRGKHTSIYKLSWDAVDSNSDSIVYYHLYKSRIPDDSEVREKISVLERKNEWELAYNGTDTFWILSGLKIGAQYNFRLFASNRLGVNSKEWAQTTRPFWFGQNLDGKHPDEYSTFASIKNSEIQLLLAFVIFSLLALCFIIFSLWSLRSDKNPAKNLDSDRAILSSSNSNNPIELIPWQRRPHPHFPNTLYVNSTVNGENIDLSDIEVIDAKEITLTKLLGKGAFGEVHEAILHKNNQRVAAKVLNRNSSKDEDNCNFLKEAKFMSKFKHPHILEMLGICLNYESSSLVIILELMEAGDLLEYLRSNRPQASLTIAKPLTIDDLMSICIDVAKGCVYLEQKQFVHRDLAARNCLVSNFDPSKRVVKIADFGLTRGLYQQNYYRKEGGLMPVRWMSPESLLDEYVKSGGILERPPFCPVEMYSLMKKCWSFEKESRPSFAQILKHLEALRELFKKTFDEKNCPTLVNNKNYQRNHSHQIKNFQDQIKIGIDQKFSPTDYEFNDPNFMHKATIDTNYCNNLINENAIHKITYPSLVCHSATNTTMTSLEDPTSNCSTMPRLMNISPALVLETSSIISRRLSKNQLMPDLGNYTAFNHPETVDTLYSNAHIQSDFVEKKLFSDKLI
ncbi:proto-oncogene tyrosine-protein kinase ROS-like protein [Sarcoptes scabiei]|uniref:receptor protein-tyrosine kinase n=1 Tax=Sarcoptes scabiei TaxID=52283 RepID=A0A132ABM1_SARSC|nr:proto-oncogene tyrosine-protein kinase ROS-like protein [Sarcoptes scabiei]